MDFSTAQSNDLRELTALYRAATSHMDAQGIFQWDAIYPNRSILREDISLVQMEVGRVDSKIAVAFALEFCKEGDYEPAAWRYDDARFVVLHRLCVHPAFQGQGIAQETLDYIERSLPARGIYTIRLDAFSLNPAALHLYESRGYEKAGEITYRKGLFYLYEKKL